MYTAKTSQKEMLTKPTTTLYSKDSEKVKWYENNVRKITQQTIYIV